MALNRLSHVFFGVRRAAPSMGGPDPHAADQMALHQARRSHALYQASKSAAALLMRRAKWCRSVNLPRRNCCHALRRFAAPSAAHVAILTPHQNCCWSSRAIPHAPILVQWIKCAPLLWPVLMRCTKCCYPHAPLRPILMRRIKNALHCFASKVLLDPHAPLLVANPQCYSALAGPHALLQVLLVLTAPIQVPDGSNVLLMRC